MDVIVTGTAGEATEGLLAAVREAVDKIAGPYDNILVKSSVTVSQNISVTVTTDTADTDEAVENRIKAILTELLAVRRSRKLNELTLSDINHACLLYTSLPQLQRSRKLPALVFALVGQLFEDDLLHAVGGGVLADDGDGLRHALPGRSEDRPERCRCV